MASPATPPFTQLETDRIPRESNGCVPVCIQDQTSRPLDLYFATTTGQPAARTLSVATAEEDTTITLSDATGMLDGQYFGIFGGDPDVAKFYFGTQVGAPVGNVITIDSPMDTVFDAGSVVLPLRRNIAVDGSSTPVIFSIQAGGTGSQVNVDITRIIGVIECDSAVDLNKFGNLDELTKGLVLRRNNGIIENIWNVKKNGGFTSLAYDLQTYDSSNPSQGVDGVAFRYTFAGQDKHGVAVRLEPGDTLELVVQDNLITDGTNNIITFLVTAQGHFVED